MSTVEVSPALDNSVKELSMPGPYIPRIVNPENGQPALSLSSTINCDFLLPNTVYNLSRSWLCFDISTTAENAAFGHLHSGFLAPIDGIILSTADGQRLVDANEVAKWTRLVWRPFTDYQKFLTFPKATNGYLLAAAATVPCSQLFARSGTAAAAVADNPTFCTGSRYFTGEADGKTIVTAEDDYTGIPSFCGLGDATANHPVVMKVRLPLGLLYGTMLSLDRDVFFNQQVRLTIRFNQGKYFGFNTPTSLYDVAAATNAAANNLGAVPVISNCTLRLMVETNEGIAQAIKSKVLTAGVTFDTPFYYHWRGVSTAASSDTFIRRLNRGHGKKCMRIISGVFSANDNGSMYCSLYNVDGCKWTTYKNMLDAKPLSDETLQIADHSAYMYNHEKWYGSVIKSEKDWEANAIILEDFSGVRYSKDFVETDHAVSGIDLSSEREFQTTIASAATAQPVFIFAETLKTITVTSAGVQIM